jgi:hypothetical protein
MSVDLKVWVYSENDIGLFFSFFFKVAIDECDTATEMYSCAVNKIPNLLPEMIVQDSESAIV